MKSSTEAFIERTRTSEQSFGRWGTNAHTETSHPKQGTDGQTINEASIPLGTKLNDTYLVRSILGRGSMGIVYLSHDLRLERDVAIKVLAPNYAADERVAERFRREAIAMASIRAENVVQIFSSGDYRAPKKENLLPYFVMEYVPGYTVASLIEHAAERGEELYFDVVLGVLRQAARGLQVLHDNGIVHRDVKPPNMLVGPHFKVAVADFGLVELVDIDGDARGLAGTPLYLAPELIRRETAPEQQRHLCDVYSLGVSAYEMLTGDVPFDGSSVKEILRGHLRDTPRPISDLRADLPTDIDAVINRALEKNPADRYPSCISFVDELAAAREKNTHNHRRTGSLRLQVISADPQNRTMYCTALKVAFPDAQIYSATEGIQALEIAECCKPDFVLLDLDRDLGGMNGLEICAALRGDELSAGVKIVTMTQKENLTLQKVLGDLGIDDIIQCPIEPTELIARVRQLIDT